MAAVGFAGMAMLVAGIVLAVVAEARMSRADLVELAAGLLIVGGLTLIGMGVECAFNPGACRLL
ncbi:MAG: hypothetical protein ACTHLO_15135 [Pseudolabrys sp.]